MRIGHFFSGLSNYNKPLVLSGIAAIKNQATETGKAVINEFGRKYLRNIIQEQSKISLQYLSNKAIYKIQSGSGKRNKKLGVGSRSRSSQLTS